MNRMEFAISNWVVSGDLSKVLFGQIGAHDLQSPLGSGYPDSSSNHHCLSNWGWGAEEEGIGGHGERQQSHGGNKFSHFQVWIAAYWCTGLLTSDEFKQQKVKSMALHAMHTSPPAQALCCLPWAEDEKMEDWLISVHWGVSGVLMYEAKP